MADKSIKITIATALNAAGFTAARRAISSLVDGTRNFAKGVGANLMNIKAGFDMVSGAAMKVYSIFRDITQKAFNVEYLLTNFKTLTGSIDIARAHIAELKKFASETPLTIGDLSGASKILLAYGATLDSIIPNLKMLGDISLGNSEKFAHLVMAFGKVQSQGRMTALELKQMVLAGFNPLQEISKATGVSMLDLKKDMENGAISFDLLKAAMASATGAGGRFNNALLDASKTGNGLMSTLQDNWNMAIASFGAAFVEARKEGLEKMIEKLQELQRDGSITLWANKTKEAIDSITDAAKACGNAVSFIWNKSGISDVYRMATGTVKAFGAAGTRYFAGLANGESLTQASKASWSEGGAEYQKEQAKGYYSGMLAKNGWLGSGMKAAYDDNKASDDYEIEQAKRSAKKAQEDAARAKKSSKSADVAPKSIAETLAESKAAAVKEDREKAIDEYAAKIKAAFGGEVEIPVEVEKPAPVSVEVEKPAPVSVDVEKQAPVSVDVEKPAPVSVDVEKPAPVSVEVEKPAPVAVEVTVDESQADAVRRELDKLRTIGEVVKPDMSGVRAAYADLAKARTADELNEAKKRVDAAIKEAKEEADAFRELQKRKREQDTNANAFVNDYEKEREADERSAAKASLDEKRDNMKKLHDERIKQIEKEIKENEKVVEKQKELGAENPMTMAGGGFWGNGTLDQAAEVRSEHQKEVDEERAAKAEEALKKKMEKRGATLADPSKLGRMSNLERAAFERMKLKEAEKKAEQLQKEKDAREKKMADDLDAINKKLKEVGL